MAEDKLITELGNPRKPQGDEGIMMLCEMNEHHSDVTDWALGFFEFCQSDKVLDIGCGGGATLKKMSAYIDNTGHLTGVDYSNTSVSLTSITNKEDIVTGKMDVINGSVECLPFKDNSFDKIITVESFYFWPNPVENLKEVCRVLNKCGVFQLVADIYGKDDLNVEALDNIEKYNMLNPTVDEFENMLKLAGFDKVIIKTKPQTDWICAMGIKY